MEYGSVKNPLDPWKIRGIDGITTELQRNVTLTKLRQKICGYSIAFSMFPVCYGRTDFFISDVLGVINCESSSDVRKTMGCLNCKYAICIFIRRCLTSIYHAGFIQTYMSQTHFSFSHLGMRRSIVCYFNFLLLITVAI